MNLPPILLKLIACNSFFGAAALLCFHEIYTQIVQVGSGVVLGAVVGAREVHCGYPAVNVTLFSGLTVLHVSGGVKRMPCRMGPLDLIFVMIR
jgi:hypothetical protein